MDKADAGALQQLSAKLAAFAPPGSSAASTAAASVPAFALSASTGAQDAVVEPLAYRGSPAQANLRPAQVQAGLPELPEPPSS